MGHSYCQRRGIHADAFERTYTVAPVSSLPALPCVTAWPLPSLHVQDADAAATTAAKSLTGSSDSGLRHATVGMQHSDPSLPGVVSIVHPEIA